MKSRCFTAGMAAKQLGISTKALRLYEQHGLLAPGRTRAGWRSYGMAEMARAAEIVRLRKLGCSLAEIGETLEADPQRRETLLARHRLRLEGERRRLDATLRAIDRAGAAQLDQSLCAGGCQSQSAVLAFDLPWPWDGERFVLEALPSLTFITGPLGSGKTRLAMRLAQALPGGSFLGLDRLSVENAKLDDQQCALACSAPVSQAFRTLADAGVTCPQALTVLVEAIYANTTDPLVIDMVEQGLDHRMQEALVALLRRDSPTARPLVLMTRSSAILDLAKAESGEMIIYCPANHGPPMIVRPVVSCPGYEAVATCLAAPAVRTRTAGVIAVRAATPHAPNDDSRETFC